MEHAGRTAAGIADAESRISADLDTITQEVCARWSDRMHALLLVGGYARGEGGAVERGGAFGPYNDYDLVLITRDDAKSARAPLLALGHTLTQRLGVEVELWPVERAALSTMHPTLFWLDVKQGGVEVLSGSPKVLDELPEITARDVPLAEAARLLANRATGLALSNFEPVDRDLRKARHGHKAVLACGDALLLAADRYAPTVRARAAELERLRAAPAVGGSLRALYADAARFRARPDAWSPGAGLSLDAWYASVVSVVAKTHLAFEARRVGTPQTPAGYASSRIPLFAGAPDISALPFAALRAAARRRTPLTPWIGHPRERLARVAVALAYQPRGAGSRAIAARLLGLGPDPTDEALHGGLRQLTEVAG